VKQESFQHYYVFVTLLNNVFVEGVNIYINLASEVRVKFTKNKFKQSMKKKFIKVVILLLLLPLVFWLRILLELFLTSFQDSQFQSNVNMGTVNGVSTDFDGKFQLSNVKKGDNIVFSYWLHKFYC
jgi:hypothetical protein